MTDPEPPPEPIRPFEHGEILPPEPPPVPPSDLAPEAEPETLPPPVERPVPAAPPATRRGGTPFLLTLVLFAGLAAGLYWVWANPGPRQAGAPPPDQQVAEQLSGLQAKVQAQDGATAPLAGQIQDLGKQVASLSARLDKLEQAPAAVPTAPSQPASADTGSDTAKRLDELTARLEALSAKEQSDAQSAQAAAQAAQTQAPPQAAPKPAEQAAPDPAIAEQKSAIEALGGRVAKLEQGAGQFESQAGKTARAVRLDEAGAALAAGQPLGVIPGAPPALARFATAAPPTETALRRAFPAAAEQARAVSAPDSERKSFLDRAFARMQQSVTIRRGDHVIVGDPASGILAHAQEDVASGDLAGALHALSALQGPAAAAIAGWAEQAEALLAARAALAALAAHG